MILLTHPANTLGLSTRLPLLFHRGVPEEFRVSEKEREREERAALFNRLSSHLSLDPHSVPRDRINKVKSIVNNVVIVTVIYIRYRFYE